MKVFFAVFFLLSLTINYQANAQSVVVRYVKQGGTGAGTSWAQASGDLQAMINASSEGDQVWVVAGEYQPAAGQSFTMKEGVGIYGGFPDTGNPGMGVRNWKSNETVLRGNGNSVIKNELNNLTNSTVLDGFTVTGGHAFNGGGIYNYNSSPTYTNLLVTRNSAENFGGGIMIMGICEPIFTHVNIKGNSTDGVGGGIYNHHSRAKFTHVVINENTAVTAGGVLNSTSPSSYTHVVIRDNYASSTAGGVVNSSSETTYTHVIISGNKANIIGGMYNVIPIGIDAPYDPYSPILNHVIISGNVSESDAGGVANSNSEPKLTNVKIIGNIAKNGGGGMLNINAASPIMTNVTISGNYAATRGSGIMNYSGTPTLINTIVWGNRGLATNISHFNDSKLSTSSSFNLIESPLHQDSNIPGDFSGLEATDIFVSHVQATSDTPTVLGDFRLKAGSPAVNVGSNNLLWQAIRPDETASEPDNPAHLLWGTDLEDQHRVWGGRVDLGAYESSYENVESVSAPLSMSVDYGTAIGEIRLPNDHLITVKMSDGRTLPAVIDPHATNWTLVSGGTNYDPLKAGLYVFKAALVLPDRNATDWYTNNKGLEVEIRVTVLKHTPQISVRWNGVEVDPLIGLTIPFGEVGTLAFSNNNTDEPVFTYALDSDLDKLLDISDLTVVRNLRTGQGRMNVDLSETDNFHGVSLSIPVVVTRALIKGIGFADRSFIYDGTQKLLEINGVLPVGTSVSYVNNGRIDVGEQIVTANILGNENYLDLNLSAVLSITPANQVISHNIPAELGRYAIGFVPVLSSGSGLPVRLSIDNTSIVSWSGTELQIHQLGTVMITMTQEGGGNYKAADPVTVAVRVVDPSLDIPLIIHQALSPNGDGMNDELIIEGIRDFPENRVVILNRNGTVMWETSGYENTMNTFRGISNQGRQLPSGTYYYVVEIKIGGQWQAKKGFFVLKNF